MPDDKTNVGGQDQERINVHEDHALHGWSKTLGVTKERLKEAVHAVGDRASKVREYLKGGSKPK